MKIGGVFEEDADVDDGGAERRRFMRIEVKEDYPAGAAAIGTARVHRQSSGNFGRNHSAGRRKARIQCMRASGA